MTLRLLGVSAAFPRCAEIVRSVKPSLCSNNDKFSVRGDLLHLRAESGGRLRADEGIGKVAIDLAKILHLPGGKTSSLLANETPPRRMKYPAAIVSAEPPPSLVKNEDRQAAP